MRAILSTALVVVAGTALAACDVLGTRLASSAASVTSRHPRHGVSCVVAVQGVGAWGRADPDAAARQGHVRHLRVVDYDVDAVLGLQRRCIHVGGD